MLSMTRLMRCALMLVLLQQSTASWAGRFQAGVASVSISPTPKRDRLPTLAAGIKPVPAVSDPLAAKALVLEDGAKKVAIISLDLIGLRPSDFEYLLAELRERRGFHHVLVSVTHTHSGFVVDEGLDALRPKILAAVDSASSNMRPVKIGAGEVRVDEAYNRRVVEGGGVEMLWSNPARTRTRPVDTALGIISFVGGDGRSLATIVNYAAHPVVTMDQDDVVISADYPGEISRHINKTFGGETLFLLGAGGDVNPYDAATEPLDAALKKSRAVGSRLGYAAVQAIGKIDNYRSEGEFRFETSKFGRPQAEIGALILTPEVAMATFPGEYFDEFGRSLKQHSPVPHTFFVSMANGSLGYVPTASDVFLGGYGADANNLNVSADTGKQHLDKALEMLSSLVAKP
jgi:hypothetical protein